MRAAELNRNAIANLMNRHAWWMVPAAWVIRIYGLTIFAGVVDRTCEPELFGRCPHKGPLLQAGHICSRVGVDWAVAYKELVVPLVVHSHINFKLDDAASCVSPMGLLHRGVIITAAWSLVTISTDTVSISTMWAIAVLAAKINITCWGLPDVAVTQRKMHMREQHRRNKHAAQLHPVQYNLSAAKVVLDIA